MAGLKFTVKFILQQTTDKGKQTPLRCFVRFNNTRAVFPSGVVIEPKFWNPKSQEPRQTASLQNLNKITSDLANVKKWVDSAFNYISTKTKEYPDPEMLKDLALLIIKNDGVNPYGEKEIKSYSFFEFAEKMIQDTKNGKRVLGEGQRYSSGTIKAYGSAIGILKGYFDHVSSTGKKGSTIGPLQFEDIDLEYYEGLKEWCYKLREKRLSDNYFGTVVKFIKTVMSEAAELGLHNSNKYKSKNFVKVKTEVDNVYLNKDQLDLLAKHDFSKNKKLERVRDLFLVGAWTGLRFSDFTNIQAKNIKGDFIEIETQKTGESVAIPIHSTVREIMARYDGITDNSLPPAISNVKLNEYIKIVAKEVGLVQPVTLKKSISGSKVYLTNPLFELITTHSARRSFASNMYHMGVPTGVIMAVTGHRTEAAFNTYLKITPKEKAQIMKEHWARESMKVVKESVA